MDLKAGEEGKVSSLFGAKPGGLRILLRDAAGNAVTSESWGGGRGLPAAVAELPAEAGGDDAASGEAPGAADARAIPGPAPGVAAGLPLVAAPPPAPAFDVRAYGEHVRRRIDAEKRYPGRARRLGLAGVATVIVTVDGHGHLATAPRLARSSGVAALDAEALRMARAAAPFSPPAGAAAPLVVHVPVRFSWPTRPEQARPSAQSSSISGVRPPRTR